MTDIVALAILAHHADDLSGGIFGKIALALAVAALGGALIAIVWRLKKAF